MIQHDPTCLCAICNPSDGPRILQQDCEMLADAWASARGLEDGEVRKLRAGEHGAPGSTRRIALQAIATTRVAATIGRQIGETLEGLLK